MMKLETELNCDECDICDDAVCSDARYNEYIICPICGEMFVHLVGSSIKVEETIDDTIVIIPWYCEFGHQGTLKLVTHKGTTYVQHEENEEDFLND